MKNAIIFFKGLNDYIKGDFINLVLCRFSQSNFPIDSVFTVSDEKKEEVTEFVSNIRQAYDNVIVLNYGCKKFKPYEIIDKSCIYNDSHGRDDFSLFVVEGDICERISSEVIPSLEKKYQVKYGKVIFKTYGIDEDKIRKITDLIESKSEVRFNILSENLDCRVELVYNDKSTKMDYDFAQKEFITALKDYVYADSDVTLEKMLVDLLKLRKCVMSTAESFTGGNISARITSVSGASSVFYEGIVSYNENSKRERLSVKEESLKKFKPVSAQVAGEMAWGLVRDKKADIGISTTGIAGPNTDDSGFPVGLCFIGVAYGGEIKVYKYNFDGDRKSVVEKGTKTAMFLAIKCIKNI